MGVQARYDEDGPLVQARLAWFRLTVFPRKKKQASAAQEPSEKDRKKAEKKKRKALQKKLKKQQKKQKKEDKKQESAQAPRKKGGNLDLILELVRVGVDFLGTFFRRKLVVENIDVLVRFGGTDPSKIAINYGRAWAGIGCLNPLLENTFKIKKRNIRAEISEDVKSVDVTAELSLYIRVYCILALALRYGFRVLWIFLRDKRNKQKQAKLQARALQLEAAAQK